ncbi:hypothetical protein EMCRGX_G028710, partial [Ephydatia muelleri]
HMEVEKIEGADSTPSGGLISTRAEDYGNAPDVEFLWAVKAMKYAETHFKLLQTNDCTSLRLTRQDDELFEEFEKAFKDLKIDVINTEDIKCEGAKEAWRDFCNKFEDKVKSFNFGTLLRMDSSKDYSAENTVLVPRAQFLAIEVARNKKGLNLVHYTHPTGQ